jgi:hypothetical protein
MAWNKLEFGVSQLLRPIWRLEKKCQELLLLMKVLVVFLRHLLQSVLFLLVVMIDWAGMQKIGGQFKTCSVYSGTLDVL